MVKYIVWKRHRVVLSVFGGDDHGRILFRASLAKNRGENFGVIQLPITQVYLRVTPMTAFTIELVENDVTTQPAELLQCRLTRRLSYDRMIGECKLFDGTSISRAMIRGGHLGRWW